MLPLRGQAVEILDPILGVKQRVACITGGVVVSIQIIDSEKRAGTEALFDVVRDLGEHEQCNEGWLLDGDRYVAPPESVADVKEP